MATATTTDLEVVFNAPQVHDLVNHLAAEIAEYYGPTPFTMVGILNACAPFMCDLIKALPPSIQYGLAYDFVQASSRRGMDTTGQVEVVGPHKTTRSAGHLLVVDTMVDSGITLSAVLPILWRTNPKSIKVCALLNKVSERQEEVPVDFCGQIVPPRFLVGYGLDLDGDYRALPEIFAVN